MRAQGRQCILALSVAVLASLNLATAWTIPAGTPARTRHAQQPSFASDSSAACSTTSALRATPSSSDDGDIGTPASLTRAGWLRVGAGLAAIAPMIVLGGKEDAALAASTGGV